MSDRIGRFTEKEGRWGENIDYGVKSPEDVMLALLVDDGVADRGHRKNMYSEAFTKMGAATSSHPRYGQSTVIDYNGHNPFKDSKRPEVEKPAGYRSWSSSSKYSYEGSTVVKTTIYDFEMKDGTH